CTFLINSACHFIGTQPYSKKNSARDNSILAIFTYGEGYHNYHHKFQADYRNGIRWYHWDPTKWLISGMAKLRFAHNLKQVSPDEILKARLTIEEEQLRARGVPAETLSSFRFRVEEAQKRLTRLKSDYAAFKATKREQFDKYLQEKRQQYELLRDEASVQYERMFESWTIQKQALRAQVRDAKLQFRVARQEWKQLREAA
ncbi:MAG: acyl-CoA desaturase, partial [Bdellovibrionia bacterium]